LAGWFHPLSGLHQFSEAVHQLGPDRVEAAGENILLGISKPQIQRIVRPGFRQPRPDKLDGAGG